MRDAYSGAGSGREAPQPPLSVAMLANNNENEITNTVLKSANHIDSPLIAETPAKFRFERLYLHRSALVVGGKLKHPSLHRTDHSSKKRPPLIV